jgi:hypothetical protein
VGKGLGTEFIFFYKLKKKEEEEEKKCLKLFKTKVTFFFIFY